MKEETNIKQKARFWINLELIDNEIHVPNVNNTIEKAKSHFFGLPNPQFEFSVM